ncbi:hypothetical protein GCM10010988_26620 [Cnuibacter physcomitrellae]|uniref:cytochrome c oxidase assembly protein n=1 Tax=Cnuibacter physcomitrellae TaxID=1619308 RepID=UPI0019C6FA2D|nr:cytochrome c oxidase assembly protein [Cnuibacter physcomitrellae]GGI39945.1 hypothetical protein GCM10010988_26620 [Cnuibacter physcomitrellae]
MPPAYPRDDEEHATPDLLTVLTAWRFDPLAAAVLVLAAALYLAGVWRLRRSGGRWPVRRTLGFLVLGLGSYAVIEFGFLAAYGPELRFAFSTRIALLLFVVPVLLATGKPLELARLTLRGRAARGFAAVERSRVTRILGNAAVGTVIAVALFCTFLTPVSGWVRTTPWADSAVGLLIPLIGSAVVLPLAGMAVVTSLALAAEFILAFAELVLDAIPGIVLRLNDGILDGVPALVGSPAWFPSALRDQQMSGDLLWLIAEVADIPILILLFVRWARLDRREARRVDDLDDEALEELTRQHLRRRDG